MRTALKDLKASSRSMLCTELKTELEDYNFDDVLIVAKQPNGDVLVLSPEAEFANHMVLGTCISKDQQEESAIYPLKEPLESFFKAFANYRYEEDAYCSEYYKYGNPDED